MCGGGGGHDGKRGDFRQKQVVNETMAILSNVMWQFVANSLVNRC